MLGDKDHPLRCSKLVSLVRCNMRVFIVSFLDCEDDEGGVPAQTGSLAHAGVAEFHRFSGTLLQRKKAAWEAIKAHAGDFPLADETEVRLFITPYMDDPRNIEAEILTHPIPKKDKNGKIIPGEFTDELMVEQQVEFTLPPHPLDPTEGRIHIQGTLDQIRKSYGIPQVNDYKTGKISGFQMIHDYAFQIAAYTYGARELGIKDCQPGPIIRGHGYRTRDAVLPSPQGVFFEPPFLWDKVEELLETVQLSVALYRMGYINYGPGPHCTYCELGGINQCTAKFEEIQLGLLQRKG